MPLKVHGACFCYDQGVREHSESEGMQRIYTADSGAYSSGFTALLASDDCFASNRLDGDFPHDVVELFSCL